VGELDLLNLSKTVLVSATLVSMPILVAVGAVGLVVSLIQALTQVQEQSLSFVPKLLAGVGTVLALGSWMLTVLTDLAVMLLGSLGTPS
tara:strand:- start:230 stop:496 length:267 start_codon:yes stop_codon:yes gene_type:complete